MDTSSPRISVIIPVHYGREYLKLCFSGVIKTNYENMEIIVVDSGSKDGSIEYLESFRNCTNKKILIIKLEKNPGVCAARNIGVKHSTGDILAFLDQDATPHVDWLTKAIPYFLKNKKLGIIQCKLLLFDDINKIDSLGYYLDKTTLYPVHLVSPGITLDNENLRSQYIFGVKGAGMLVRRKTFLDIGAFDEDYFFWYEENDLCWRTWRAGYEVMLVPESIVYHIWGSRKQTLPNEYDFSTFFYAPRNSMYTVIKNSTRSQVFNILLHVAGWLAVACVAFKKKRWRRSLLILTAIYWIIKNMGKILQKRHLSRINQKVPQKVYVTMSLKYLLKRASVMVS